jgi:hypothetical protein
VPREQKQQQSSKINHEQAEHLALHNGIGSNTVLPPLPSYQPSARVVVPAPNQPGVQQQPESEEPMAYVGNVAFEATQEELQGLFAPYGCTLVRLHKDKKTGRPKGFAHAHFRDRASLDRCMGDERACLHVC